MNFISENILKLKKQKGMEVCSKILSKGQGKGKGSSHGRGVCDGKINGTYIMIFVDKFLLQDKKDILMEDVGDTYIEGGSDTCSISWSSPARDCSDILITRKKDK